MSRARYIVGIDLGTTNTAVATVDTRSADMDVRVFETPQLVAPGATDGRQQLPSFIYLAGEHDLSSAETALPWARETRQVVGELARAQGTRQPSRMIASSKSWLCHPGVDRQAPILPWGVEAGPKLSPVQASSCVLAHLAAAWDWVHRGEADARFAEQDIIVTVPASFDEAARELTLEAARQAGLSGVVLLEEPQAAFYAWAQSHPAQPALSAGERVLVFDVGGGTTDFSVVAVREGSEPYQRTAVGDHLLLGGDNIDLTLAKTLETRLLDGAGERHLDSVQWHGLVHACRLAKETLLCTADVASLPIAVSGRSSKLIGGTLKAELTRTELEELIFDGFFPLVAPDDQPRRSRSGLQEFGLPFAADPAVTRHLAAFLRRHRIGPIHAVLFNGGTMAPAALRRRVLEQLAAWQAEPPRELVSRQPELAVAEGAAVYGLVRRGLGVRIGGGTPRSFYVGVGEIAGTESAVCLAPPGLVEGKVVELERDFRLLTNRPVSFKLYSSSTRADEPGTLLSVAGARAESDQDAGDLIELPPIVSVVRAAGRGEVTVHLQVRMTELGELEIWCREPNQPESSSPGWRLSFDMRAGGARAESKQTAPANDAKVPRAQELAKSLFQGPPESLARVNKVLEEILGAGREEWPTATARALFDALFEVEQERKRSAEHEARWLNLTGFCLRPGVGAPLDHWRANQMWRIFNDELIHPGAEQCRLAWWIVWRRVAGGLSKGQQHQIYLRLAQLFLPGSKGKKKWFELKPSEQEAAEMLRCLANLERLSPDAKTTLGDQLILRLQSKRRDSALFVWALARLGARVPLYGPLNAVLPARTVERWIEALLSMELREPQKAGFALAQLARRTGDRGRDLDDAVRTRVALHLRSLGAERAALLVEHIVALDAREECIALGDTLPAGLRLAPDQPEAAPPTPGPSPSPLPRP
jgi:molecular chaperone DnaK (HSP70)